MEIARSGKVRQPAVRASVTSPEVNKSASVAPSSPTHSGAVIDSGSDQAVQTQYLRHYGPDTVPEAHWSVPADEDAGRAVGADCAVVTPVVVLVGGQLGPRRRVPDPLAAWRDRLGLADAARRGAARRQPRPLTAARPA